MRYDVLDAYRRYLSAFLSPLSASLYRNRLDKLIDSRLVGNIAKQVDISNVINRLSKIKYKNHFSQSKNAFLHFCKFSGITLTNEQMKTIHSLQEKTHKKYRKQKEMNYQEIKKKIDKLKNEKLKLSFETILATGLRVSELAQIRPEACTIDENKIILEFIGKGNIQETVTVHRLDYPELFTSLNGAIEKTPDNKGIFYSAIYLQIKAKELDFACHDLRRIYAKLEYKKCKSKEQVKEKLRHSNKKTTNIYLKSKVKL